jgi:hypothetical protein
MYAVVRKFKMTSVDEAGRKAAKELGPMLKKNPGFRGYYVIKFGDDVGGSLTLFDTREASEDGHRKALGWIKANLADHMQGEPEVWTGEVVASVMPDDAKPKATAA